MNPIIIDNIYTEKEKLKKYILKFYSNNEKKAQADLFLVDMMWKNIENGEVEKAKYIVESIKKKYEQKKKDKRWINFSATISIIVVICSSLFFLLTIILAIIIAKKYSFPYRSTIPQ
jgi:nitrogen fixation/metabolism regulation signal transduction histidine kinase